jgi:hypothetical protein
MRLALTAASLLVLAGCASHDKAAATSTDPHHAVLASDGGKAGCHGAASTAELASTESVSGTKSCASKAEMASTEGGKSCPAKAELASMEEGGKSCHMKQAEMASAEDSAASCNKMKTAEMASADSHQCSMCPKKADGTCDHEAGSKAGHDCCKSELAKTTTP